jgi:hypothetical protein
MSVLEKAFITPDFDQKLAIVHSRAELYSETLNVQARREKQQDDVLEWISPNSAHYLTPKYADDIGNTCQEFLQCNEYLNWVGNGPPILICTGRRMSPTGTNH